MKTPSLQFCFHGTIRLQIVRLFVLDFNGFRSMNDRFRNIGNVVTPGLNNNRPMNPRVSASMNSFGFSLPTVFFSVFSMSKKSTGVLQQAFFCSRLIMFSRYGQTVGEQALRRYFYVFFWSPCSFDVVRFQIIVCAHYLAK